MSGEYMIGQVNRNNFSANEIEEYVIIYECSYCGKEFMEPVKVRKHILEDPQTEDTTM